MEDLDIKGGVIIGLHSRVWVVESLAVIRMTVMPAHPNKKN
jgi:hypothetical protein